MPRNSSKVAPAPAKTHYEVLGLDPRCSTAEIKKSYQKIALENHSDKLIALNLSDEAKAQASALFIAASAAQEVLLDAASRKVYDVGLALKGIALGDRFGSRTMGRRLRRRRQRQRDRRLRRRRTYLRQSLPGHPRRSLLG